MKELEVGKEYWFKGCVTNTDDEGFQQFRACLKEEKEMIPAELMEWDLDGGEFEGIGDRITFWKDADEIEIMQSTGLKDKNGTLIYAGDIVVARDYDDEQGVDVYEVCYLEESLEWVLRYIVKDEEFELSIIGWDELEVIGNVYENKELLE